MDSAAISSAVGALSGTGVLPQIAVSLLNAADQAEQAQIATLFSSIGIGQNVSAVA